MSQLLPNNIKSIHAVNTEKEYHELLSWVDNQFDLAIISPGTESPRLRHALSLIKQYEDTYYSIPRL